MLWVIFNLNSTSVWKTNELNRASWVFLRARANITIYKLWLRNVLQFVCYCTNNMSDTAAKSVYFIIVLWCNIVLKCFFGYLSIKLLYFDIIFNYYLNDNTYKVFIKRLLTKIWLNSPCTNCSRVPIKLYITSHTFQPHLKVLYFKFETICKYF